MQELFEFRRLDYYLHIYVIKTERMEKMPEVKSYILLIKNDIPPIYTYICISVYIHFISQFKIKSDSISNQCINEKIKLMNK